MNLWEMEEDEFESPYDEGYAAGYADKEPDCPYEEGTLNFDEWWAGYNEGWRNS